VAEEGLDIGDVNLIISYDCLASPIRMVQRFGRTGRAGAGKVIVLISRGEEENKYKQSKVNSRKIMDALKEQSKRSKPEVRVEMQSNLNFGQRSAFQMVEEEKLQAKIQKGETLVLYGFNSRMIPDEVHSKPVYRKLAQRSEDELKQIEKIKQKVQALKRKSRSVDPTKAKSEYEECKDTRSEEQNLS
jgi:superfamily II DNA/RNA helicase